MIYCCVVCWVNFVSYLTEASVTPQENFSSQAIQSYQDFCVNKGLSQHESSRGKDFFTLWTSQYSALFPQKKVDLGENAMESFPKPMINTLAARTFFGETALYKILCFMYKPTPLEYKKLTQFLREWTALNYVMSTSVHVSRLRSLIQQYVPECALKAKSYVLSEQYTFPEAMLPVITWIKNHFRLQLRRYSFDYLQEARCTHRAEAIVVDRAQLVAGGLIEYKALTSFFLQEARCTHLAEAIVVDRVQLVAGGLIEYEALTSLFIKALPAALDEYGIKKFLEYILEKCQTSFIIQLENEGILRRVDGKYQIWLTEKDQICYDASSEPSYLRFFWQISQIHKLNIPIHSCIVDTKK